MSNLIATPRLWDKKAVVLKAETTYGTDANPTGAANWFEARDVQLTSYDIETAERNVIQDYLGHSGKIVASKWSKLSFKMAVAGSGAAGTAPKWGPAILPCGFAQTVDAGVSVAYNLVSSGIGSVTAYLVIDGVLYKFVGCRGSVKASLTAKGIPEYTVELTSLYTAPAAGDVAGVSKTGWQYEEAVNSANTGKLVINSVDLAFSAFEWDVANQVSRIDLPGPQLMAAIRDRQPTATATVLAPALGVFNPYALADSGATVDLSNTHGSAAGKRVKHDLKVRVMNITEAEIDGMAAYNLSFDCTPVAGNDEITITVL